MFLNWRSADPSKNERLLFSQSSLFFYLKFQNPPRCIWAERAQYGACVWWRRTGTGGICPVRPFPRETDSSPVPDGFPARKKNSTGIACILFGSTIFSLSGEQTRRTLPLGGFFYFTKEWRRLSIVFCVRAGRVKRKTAQENKRAAHPGIPAKKEGCSGEALVRKVVCTRGEIPSQSKKQPAEKRPCRSRARRNFPTATRLFRSSAKI